jgi:hypothetical protein
MDMYYNQKIKNKTFNLIQTRAFYDSNRQEPRFQKILKDLEAKYQAEYERGGLWLKEKGVM